MSKAINAMRAQRIAARAELPARVVEAGIEAYRECVRVGIVSALVPEQVHALVVRVYRAMRAVE